MARDGCLGPGCHTAARGDTGPRGHASMPNGGLPSSGGDGVMAAGGETGSGGDNGTAARGVTSSHPMVDCDMVANHRHNYG